MMDKPVSYYAFQMLYWCGIREGELLALTTGDFDFKNKTVTINKSYQRLHGEDVITPPKTAKSNRTIKMPNFLCEEMQEYITMFYSAGENDRIFPISKSYMYKVVSLFSGCGGADLGIVGNFEFNGKKYDKNPFSLVYALDIDNKDFMFYLQAT